MCTENYKKWESQIYATLEISKVEGGGTQSISLRKIKTVFKHHLSLSEEADLLHVNSKICIVTWKFSFKKIRAKARASFDFWLKTLIYS